MPQRIHTRGFFIEIGPGRSPQPTHHVVSTSGEKDEKVYRSQSRPPCPDVVPFSPKEGVPIDDTKGSVCSPARGSPGRGGPCHRQTSPARSFQKVCRVPHDSIIEHRAECCYSRLTRFRPRMSWPRPSRGDRVVAATPHLRCVAIEDLRGRRVGVAGCRR